MGHSEQDERTLPPEALCAKVSLSVLEDTFSVCKFGKMPAHLLESEFCFIARTDEELSVVCKTAALGDSGAGADGPFAREDGWRTLKVAGPLDFSLVGILAKIASALADAGVPLFAVSTFDTDYVLVKDASLPRALAALRDAGCNV